MRLLGEKYMNFKNKYMIRNKTIDVLSWFCGLTSLTLVYTFIRWQKVKYYGDLMYDHLDLSNSNHIEQLYNSYFQIGGYSVLWCLLLAFIIDLIIRKTIIRL